MLSLCAEKHEVSFEDICILESQVQWNSPCMSYTSVDTLGMQLTCRIEQAPVFNACAYDGNFRKSHYKNKQHRIQAIEQNLVI